MADSSIQVQTQGQQLLNQVVSKLGDATPVMREIAGMLETTTQLNFRNQGRPSWLPLADSTRKQRLRRNKGSSVLMILQDSGMLANSITPNYGPDYAEIGTNVPYAAAQHLGATINHPAGQRTVRLATRKDGSLSRQRGNPNLARFAARGKSARESTHASKAYTVTIPARPYLPFLGGAENPTLQPEAEQGLLDIVNRWLSGGA